MPGSGEGVSTCVSLVTASLCVHSVDITAHPRTRKLKQSADEVIISGTTYSKRLRSQ